MRHSLAVLAILVTGLALGQSESIQRGTVKKVDADNLTITVTQDGKDHDYRVSDRTNFHNINGQGLKERLQSLKEGTVVMFRPGAKDVLEDIGRPPADGGGGGQGNIEKGTLKAIDLDKMTITITRDGKDHDYPLAEDTQVRGAAGDSLKARLKTLKSGAEVNFRLRTRDGKEIVDGLAQGGASGGKGEPPPKVNLSKVKPLTELGTDEYQGFKGGLYPEGKNERPADHEKAGVALARKVQPLDADGKPSARGKIVLLSVGMSNTSQASEGFGWLLSRNEDVNPTLVFVNGAQGGMTAKAIQDPEDKGSGTRYWNEVDNRLKSAGVTPAQVQAIWIKEADAGPTEGFPKYAQTLHGELAKIVRLLPTRFPNVKLVYLSSRTYGGYATSRLNPEPYAYESGFSVKWLIEEQIKGESALNYDASKGTVKAPWLSWGPYLWAKGDTKRKDTGLSYDASDFGPDGTHPTSSGVAKVAQEMLTFFKNDSTTKVWFVRAK